MAINGIDLNKDGATVVVNENNASVDTHAIAEQVISDVDDELGVTSPTYRYEFDTDDQLLIARAVKLELLDGLTKAIYEGDITKLDFALYVARNEIGKGTDPYLRLVFIDGMGYKNIVIDPSIENKKMLGEDFKLVAESEDPTELGINFDMLFLKKLASELVSDTKPDEPKDVKSVASATIDEAKASMDEAAKENKETAEKIKEDVKKDDDNSSKSSSSSSSGSSSSFWDNDIVTIAITTVAVGALAYGAYKLYNYVTDEGDIVILDDIATDFSSIDFRVPEFKW